MGKVIGINTTPTRNDEVASYAYSESSVASTDVTTSGNVFMFAGITAPVGFLLCDGSAVSRTTYANLFSAIGTTYGVGNGSTTFNIPNLSGRMPVGVKSDGIVSSLGATGGSIDHVHSIGSHTHTQSHSHNLNHYHNINHQHSLKHFHTLNGHTHTMSNHQHWCPAHSHGYYASSLTEGGSGHTHTYPVRSATSTGDIAPRGGAAATGSGSADNNNIFDDMVDTSVYLSGQAGSGNAGDVGFSSDWMTSQEPGISTGYTGYAYSRSDTYSGLTDNTTLNSGTTSLTSSTYSSNTGDLSSSANVEPSNPPFLTINFIIKI